MPRRQRQNDYDDELKGGLWVNTKARSDKSPDMTGKLIIDGEKYLISAWWNQPKGGGDEYLSLKATHEDDLPDRDDRGGRQSSPRGRRRAEDKGPPRRERDDCDDDYGRDRRPSRRRPPREPDNRGRTESGAYEDLDEDDIPF